MKKLNIAELLKDCPKGMELDCTMYEDVYFDYVDELNIIHCYIQHKTRKTSVIFNQYGTYNSAVKSKCVIFPKGKTTWEGFQRPFKDGDVVACIYTNIWGKEEAVQIFILKSQTNGFCYTGYDFKRDKFFDAGKWAFDRHATEEEKQKLFDAIKANGYKWNADTKTLEKLIEPKFKVGDRIKNKIDHVIYTITDIRSDIYVVQLDTDRFSCHVVPFSVEENYELVPNKFDIKTFKPFESKVLVRNDKKCIWKPNLFGFILDRCEFLYVVLDGISYKYCIPFENNEHLLGTTNDCDEFYKTWE